MARKTKTILILGGDGYLGWSLGLALAHRTNSNVVLADNLIKREWEKEVKAKLLVPLKGPKARIAEYKKIFGKSNLSFQKLDLLNYKGIVQIIKKYKPFVIINAAQQPSAPFSMMNAKNAGVTYSNNVIGHLNVLWAVAETDKNINYIKLGSAGCYAGIDTNFVPLHKTNLQFSHKGKAGKILNSWLPMHATDFYHETKITDFLINDLVSQVWKLKIMTVQQSTIFGATIKENRALSNHGLSARFNYDAVFSTVINRFVCQLAIGHPLTLYGDGEQKTGLISLADTVENFFKFIKTELVPGKHVIVHNYTHRLSIKEIAEKLVKITKNSKITFIKNPRKEGKGILSKEFELHPLVKSVHKGKEAKLKNELLELLNFTRAYKANIDSSIIMPKINWEK